MHVNACIDSDSKVIVEGDPSRWLTPDWLQGREPCLCLIVVMNEGSDLLCHNFARTICHYVFESVK
jgi:hypothetical protein